MTPATLNLAAWTVIFVYLNSTRAYLPVFLISAAAVGLSVILFLRITHLERLHYNQTTNRTGE